MSYTPLMPSDVLMREVRFLVYVNHIYISLWSRQ